MIRKRIPALLNAHPRSPADALADLEALFGDIRKPPKVKLCSFPNCRTYSIKDRCHKHRIRYET